MVLEAQLSEVSEKEKALEKQLQAMRDASRERDRDFITLNTVLQCNQDVINVSQTNSALIQQHMHTVYLITWLVTAAIIHECYSLESK